MSEKIGTRKIGREIFEQKCAEKNIKIFDSTWIPEIYNEGELTPKSR